MAVDCIVGYSLKLALETGLLEKFPKILAYTRRVTERDGFLESFLPPEKRPAGILYHWPGSRSSRVLHASRAMGVDLLVKHVNLFKGEHKTQAFKDETDGASAIPVFRAGNFVLTEGVAIIANLVCFALLRFGQRI